MNKKETSPLGPLIESAKDFLIESLVNYEQKRFKFSIIHAITATELLLKECLIRINRILVYKNIDFVDVTKVHTLELSQIPQRLKNLGIVIPKSNIELIEDITSWRNEIIHHIPKYDKQKADTELGKLFDFLFTFLRVELKVDIKSLFAQNRSLFPLFNKIIDDWKMLVKQAKEKAILENTKIKDEIDLNNEACPECNSVGTIAKRKQKRATCQFCNTQLYYGYVPCMQCNKPILTIWRPDSKARPLFLCDDCSNEMAEMADKYADEFI